MTISETLHWGYKKLSKKSTSAALDTEVLLAFVLKKPKEFLYAHPEKKLSGAQKTTFLKLLAQREKGAPIAYLIGRKEFCGLDFFVNPAVLIPRSETELLVEEGARIMNYESRIMKKNTILIDVGTGSGCIPIAIAKNILSCHSKADESTSTEESLSPFLRDPSTESTLSMTEGLRMTVKKIKIFATDISQAALNIARHNARKNKVKINFLKGNLLSPFLHDSLFMIHNSQIFITANLPYLTVKQMKEKTIKYEPRQALYGGHNGLNIYRRLLEQIKKLSPRQVEIFLEIDPAQKNKIKNIIKKILPLAKVEIKKDLAKKDRLVIIQI